MFAVPLVLSEVSELNTFKGICVRSQGLILLACALFSSVMGFLAIFLV